MAAILLFGAKLHVVPVDRTPVNYVNVNSGKLVDIEEHHEAAAVQLSTVIDSKIDLERPARKVRLATFAVKLENKGQMWET